MRGSVALVLRRDGWWAAKMALVFIGMIAGCFLSITWSAQQSENMRCTLYILFLVIGVFSMTSGLLVKSIMETCSHTRSRQWMGLSGVLLSVAILLQVEIWIGSALIEMRGLDDDINGALTYADAVSASSLFIVLSSIVIFFIQCFRGAKNLYT